MSADIRFFVRSVPSTIPGASARFIVVRSVSPPEGPEAFRTYVLSASSRGASQTADERRAERFATEALALSAVQLAVKSDRAAANHLGLHVREAFEGHPTFEKPAALLELRPPRSRR